MHPRPVAFTPFACNHSDDGSRLGQSCSIAAYLCLALVMLLVPCFQAACNPVCTENVGGLAPPLYIHSVTEGGIQGRLCEGSPETEWEQRVTQLFRSQVRPPIHPRLHWVGNMLAWDAPYSTRTILLDVERGQ